jgi:alpha-tubulin suppressor-like RCC1 family protein
VRRAPAFVLVALSSCAGVLGIEEVSYRTVSEDGGVDADAAGGLPDATAEADAPDAPGADAGVRAAVVACGGRHSCAIVGAGAVYCWGANERAQTGVAADASTHIMDAGVGVPRPVLVPLPKPAIAMAAGLSHTCAVLNDTTVRCWGDSTYGATGTGSGGAGVSIPPSPALETVGMLTKPLTGIRQVAAGALHTCVLFETGDVACTGYDGQRQLGFDAGVQGGVLSFQRVPGVTGATALFSGDEHSCAATPRGLWCWGSNDKGQAGAPRTDAGVASPTFTAVGDGVAPNGAAGSGHTCATATRSDAAVETFCMGDNAYAESLAPTSTPLVAPLTLVRLDCRSVWAGYGNTCAVLLSGELQCAGYNGDGQLGAGNAGGYGTLKPVNGALSVVHVAIGSDHACAALDDGGIACWGANTLGQLGIGLDAGQLLPAPQSVRVP